jgi:N-acetylglutamate synthase-like GNAT family acetyltransferase
MSFDSSADATQPFSEKGFYLSEFRRRTLALAAPAEELASPAELVAVLRELATNETRVVLVSNDPGVFAGLPETPIVPSDAEGLEGAVWHALRAAGRAGLCVAGADGFARASGRIAQRLGVTKLVWVDAGGAVRDGEGRRQSFMDLAELQAMLRDAPRCGNPRRAEILREVEGLLAGGMAEVNLCSLAGLADELFTYNGSGTLFSRERYVVVRRLGVDDFDAANDLIARGVAEGYLAPRSPEAIERVLANGFGAFVKGHHLAGIAALLRFRDDPVGEIASLYTLTRFLGEGIGGHLVAHACERARELGCQRVTAVTTSDRVAGFFARNGFRRVPADEIPDAKWRDYDPARRSRAFCLCRDVAP